ncbi:MAG: right-handed parallel beta-helix repeat-containing protein [Deltaproteobacteria bacterium]|nr:right-handed parallel beta-helix repeat-containing protein [Deltaproteobacteria bacterium]
MHRRLATVLALGLWSWGCGPDGGGTPGADGGDDAAGEDATGEDVSVDEGESADAEDGLEAGEVSAVLTPSCGNGVLDPGESCDPLLDCPHACPRLDGCRIPRLAGHPWSCDSVCEDDPITACASGDDCCPEGCTLDDDDDCFTYYVDDAAGDDTRDGRSPATAWRTLARLGTAALEPGDSVGLRRGGVWHETLRVGSSGTEAQPLRFGAYGNGPKPVVAPSAALGGWIAETGGVWSAPSDVPVQQVYYDGAFLPVARHPNGGGFTMDETTGTAGYLVDDDLELGGREIAGANVLIRAVHWDIIEHAAESFDPATHRLRLTGTPSYELTAGYDYYLENRSWMLDEAGEWFYDEAEHRLYLWPPDGSDPNAHEVRFLPLVRPPSRDTATVGLAAASVADFEVRDLAIRQADLGVALLYVGRFRLAYLDVREIGSSGVTDTGHVLGVGILVAQDSSDPDATGRIDHCLVADTMRDCLRQSGSHRPVVQANLLERCGNFGPARGSTGGAYLYAADGATLEGNLVDRPGNLGVGVFGSDYVLRRNVVRRACSVLSDCGALYTWNGIPTELGYRNILFERNVVLQTQANVEGTPASREGGVGVYLDNRSRAATVRDNTVVGCVELGIYSSNGVEHTIAGNTLYGNADQLAFVEHQWGGMADFGPDYAHGIRVEGNLLYSTAPDQPLVLYQSDFEELDVATFADNVYGELYEASAFRVVRLAPSYRQTSYDFAAWQTAVGGDTSRILSPTFAVEPFVVRATSGSELVSQGTFDTGIDGWLPYPRELVHEWTEAGGLDGGCYQVTSAADGSGQLGSSERIPFTVHGGGIYRVAFSIRSSEPSRVEAGLMRHETPWTSWLQIVPTTSARADVVLLVRVPETVGDVPARVSFSGRGSSAVTYWLDNVSAQEVTELVVNDPADDSRIVVNAGEANETLGLGVPGYCDLGNTPLGPEVTLAPFTSQILLACFCNRDGACNNHERPDTCPEDCPGGP